MSVLDDWGKSFSRPFQQFTSSWKKLLTNPTKMNIGDAFTVAVPGAGALTVNAIKNPWDGVYNASTFALLYGGAAIAAPPAGAESLTGAPMTGGARLSALSAANNKAALDSAYMTTGARAGVPGTTELLASTKVPFLTKIASAGSSFGGFITKAAAVSAAARQIATPWERAIDTIKDAVSPPAAPGTSVHVSAGGADLGDPADAGVTQPIQASLTNVLMIGLFVSVVGAVLWKAFKPKAKQ